MKKTLKKLLLISLLFSAIMPTEVRADGSEDLIKAISALSIILIIPFGEAPLAWKLINKLYNKLYLTPKKETIDNNLKQAIRNNDIAKVNQILKENPIIKKTGIFLNGKKDTGYGWQYSDFLDDIFFDTPIRLAVQCGHPEIVKLFLNKINRYSLDYQNGHDGRTALMIAAENGYTDIVKLLLKHGANVNVQNNHGGIKRAIINYGRTALIIAVENDHTEIVKLLLEHGANVNEQILLIAVKNDNTEIAKLLLEYGAHVNAQDRNGQTALMIAAQHSQSAKQMGNIALKDEFDNLIKLLLVFGANPLIKDKGKTVLDQNDNEIIRRFMQRQILPILNDKEFTPLTEDPE